MLRGTVSTERQAIVPLSLESELGGAPLAVAAVIDTGFNGFLTLPPASIKSLGLRYHNTGVAELADGRLVNIRRYEAHVLWHGRQRSVLVSQTEGGAMLGMAMLHGSRLLVQVVEGGEVVVEPIQPSC
jgi:clan AA aspartic protease